jgi:predicted Na+-dependent transporter
MSDKKYQTIYEKRLSVVSQLSQYAIFVTGMILLVGTILALITNDLFAKSWGIDLGETATTVNWFILFASATITILFGWRMQDQSSDKGETRRILAYTFLQAWSVIPLIYGASFAVQGNTDWAIGVLFAGCLVGTVDSLIIIYLELIVRDNALGN